MVWFFERGAEEVTCEIRRGRQGFEVVLRGSEVSAVESFQDAAALLTEFERVPRALMAEGWRPRSVDPLGRSGRRSER